MFGSSNDKKKDNQVKVTPSTTSKSINSLGHGTFVEGTIKAENDIRIDGGLKGTLHCNGKLIIGPQGSVEGTIHCANAVIEGKFKGELRVTDLLNVKESAKISGDIGTGQLVVQAGAEFNVECIMGGQKMKAVKTENTSKVAAN